MMRVEVNKFLVSTRKFLVVATTFLVGATKFLVSNTKFGYADQKFGQPNQIAIWLPQLSQKVKSAYKVSMSVRSAMEYSNKKSKFLNKNSRLSSDNMLQH